LLSLSQIVADLARIGTIVELDPSGGLHRIVSIRGRRVDPAIRISLSEAELLSILTRDAQEASAVFPDVSPLRAAYRLFVGDLEELLDMVTPETSEIRIVSGNLQLYPRRESAAGDLANVNGDAAYRWDPESPT
jgi:hypothetical protein